ncbi:hypothetical protein C8R47DRAFT_1234986 [Mycena vitilis]|nr:hypothetical protein C8R47DRAFT_1234986 [Mycena vitilis]
MPPLSALFGAFLTRVPPSPLRHSSRVPSSGNVWCMAALIVPLDDSVIARALALGRTLFPATWQVITTPAFCLHGTIIIREHPARSAMLADDLKPRARHLNPAAVPDAPTWTDFTALVALIGSVVAFRGFHPAPMRAVLGTVFPDVPDGMVYYHVVAAVENALDDAAEDPSAPEFEALSEDWEEFIGLAQSRITIRQDLYPYMVSMQACDNIECLKTQHRSRFGRCSGCNSFYYCSRECQTIDWRRGGHREHCASYTTLTLAESKSCPLDFHERHFLRALAESLYDENVCEINARQAQKMAHAASHSGIVITLFDFVQNPMQIALEPLPESSVANTLGGIGAEWSHIVARAVNNPSRGRLHLHVILLAMNLPEDYEDRYIVDEVQAIRDRDELEAEDLVELH